MTLTKKKLVVLSLFTLSLTAFYVNGYLKEKEQDYRSETLSFIKGAVSHQIVSENHFPELIKHKDDDFEVEYTINWKIQNRLEELLKRYPNDHSAIVIIDNNNGQIVGVSGVDRKTKSINYSLPFTSTHPSASLFKIITTADLLESDKIEPHTKLNYHGRGTTLYKYQLKNKISRWTRWISFKKAFALSNNVIFGKAAIQKTSGHSIFKKAFNFGFNRQLMFDFNLGPSRFSMPESQYELAEMASGFNTDTMISPVHAALLSSIVASGGYFQTPSIIKEVKNEEKTFTYKRIKEKILDEETVEDLHQMMTLTVEKGTARGLTKGRLGRKLMEKYEVGAKTGSITGGVPFGKRDWISFFARPHEDKEDKGISVAIMNVNGKRWYYKSSFLAKKILEILDDVKNETIASSKINKSGES